MESLISRETLTVVLLCIRRARIDSSLPCFLLKQGLPVNAVSSLAQTALHYAADAGSPDLVPLLIAHGANPNITDQAGYTPLHDAIFPIALNLQTG
jgi:ankyrin repeat protein